MCWLLGRWVKVSQGTAGPPLEWNTHMNTHMNRAAQRDVVTGLHLCSSHQHINTLHCPLSAELVCVSHSSSLDYHSGDTLHEIGFHTLVIITSWKNAIAIWIYLPRHLSKQRGERRTDAFHDMLFTIWSAHRRALLSSLHRWWPYGSPSYNSVTHTWLFCIFNRNDVKMERCHQTSVGDDLNYVAFDRIAES